MSAASDNRLVSHKPRFGVERLKNKSMVLVVAGILLLALIIAVAVAVTSGDSKKQSESYKNVSGNAAGLRATIDYDCHKKCKEKFNFNVYILDENGHQVSVVRPDNKGDVRLALPEGTYILLVGKQFGKDRLFPQERIALKNGKELELKLHYKEKAL